ncbi:MAG TPA: GTP-binding protein [Allosphingosinicella sp.]|jgi:sulfate adenylyltransferase large subunit
MATVIPAKAGTSGQEVTAGLPETPAFAGVTERDDSPAFAGQEKSLLRLLTCGSVDDGKSTLLGRLLYDSKMVLDDQLAALEADSRKSGTQGEKLDFALLVDGLSAEREQGITIDVAYRFFATAKRKFIVADTPGHEQYTRNMVTGASTADLAIILVDACKGLLTQTRRHSHLVHLLGIRHIVLAVNKMDLAGYGRERFEAIVAQYRAFADEAGIGAFTAIPIAALAGDNIAARGSAMGWYRGPTLLEHLETVPLAAARAEPGAFHMAVQWVNRPDSGFRGYSGRIAGGTVRPGDEIVILPSGARSRIDRIVTFDGDVDRAVEGRSVTLTLADEVECSRGAVIASARSALAVADTLAADLVWMGDEPLAPGRAYWLKIGAVTVSATVSKVDHILAKNGDSSTFVAGLRPLQPRLYSISSSLSAMPDEAHITLAPVRYQLHNQARHGVASAHLADRSAVGDTLPVYIQPNEQFRLPQDDKAIIMIGAGTGIAPYRAFLQEREARGSTGKSWLFFGERNFRSDFLYQTEWQAWLRDGLLSRMDVAFSRDRAGRAYVQHRMAEEAADLFAWLEEGAHLYLCGDAARLAPDVHETLISIVAEEGRLQREGAEEYVRELQRSRRYQRDVY